MSRRIQLLRVKRPWRNMPTTEPELRVYSDAGKVTLAHDSDMLLLVIAAALCGGRAPNAFPWIVNGVQAPGRCALHLILDGSDKDQAKLLADEPQAAPTDEVMLLDAGETIVRGEVVWTVKTTVGSLWKGSPHLTPSEFLFVAAEILLRHSHV
jgi:hypothetical protein